MMFWKWKNKTTLNEENEKIEERILVLNGAIAEESWFDDSVTPQVFKDELNSGKGNITVWINSPGGDCVAAAQIYNMLVDYEGKVTVVIDGLAASAASVIAMAGDNVRMSPLGMLMIHNPATMAMGDHHEMQKTIDMLGEVKESIINAYAMKTNLSRAKLSRLMDEETWMNANKALDLGFIDEIIQKDSTENVDNSVLFSCRKAEKKLLNKISDQCKKDCPISDDENNLNVIREEKTAEDTAKASDLKSRLELIKRIGGM